MSRTLTVDQQRLVERRETRPIYLIDIAVDGQESLSTNGDRTVASTTYVGGDASVREMQNWSSATVELQPTVARVQQLVSQTWRSGVCRISLLPAVAYPKVYASGYVKAGYGIQGEVFADPILLIDGELTSANLASNGRIEFSVAHRVTTGRWIPSVRIGPPLCHHLPQVGTVVTWGGSNFTLQGRV